MRSFRAAGEHSGAKIRRGVILIPAALAVLFSVSGTAGQKDSQKAVTHLAPTSSPWITKDWTQWSSEDCRNVLNYSPWVHSDSSKWESNTASMFSAVKLLSALPMRQALLRQIQLEKHYDKMKAKKKQAFDQQHAADLTGGPDNNVLVNISNSSVWDPNAYESRRNPYQDKQVGPLRQAALVLSDGKFVMATDTKVLKNGELENECQYVFPRKVDGKSLFTASDSSLVIVLGPPVVVDKKIKQVVEEPFQSATPGASFKISDLMYKGKLEYSGEMRIVCVG